jgi:CBS domain-containing protein
MALPIVETYLTVGEFMDTRPIAVKPEQDIHDALRYLLAHKVTGAPVVDAEGRPLGILGERDCLRLLTEGDEAHLPEGKVRDFLRTDFQAVPPGMNIYYAAGLFLNDRNWGHRRFLVVEDGKLVGVLTRYDVLRAVEAVHERRRERGR